MERQLQPVEQRYRPCRHLAADRQSVAVGALDFAQQRAPALGIERNVEQGEGERPARDLDQAAQHGELGRSLGRGVAEIVQKLDHALAHAAHPAGDGPELFLGCGDGGREHALGGAVEQRARGREAERAGLQPFLDQLRHRGHVPGRRRFAFDAASAHDEDAQRRVRHLRREIDVAALGRQCVEILGETLPVPRHAFAHHDLGDVLDAFHDLDQGVAVLGPAGREAHTAIAHQHRGDAMAGGGRETLVPRRLPVVVRVDVDEARRHREPLGVDLLAPSAAHTTDGDDPPILHRDVGRARLAAAAIEHGAAAHHEVELRCHGFLPRETIAQGCDSSVSTGGR